MDTFGSTDPQLMPPHLFWRALHIDFSTAIRANITVQDYSVCPRHWYVDARFRCDACAAEFTWSAEEQRAWFETYRFYVDSRPTRCRDCRVQRRNALQLRQEYDALVSAARAHGTREQKQRVVEIVDELERAWSGVPDKMRETRDLFRKQIAKHHSE